MTIDRQIEIKQTVIEFIKIKFPSFPEVNATDVFELTLTTELYNHLDSKGMIPQGMNYSTYHSILVQKFNWAIMAFNLPW